MEKIDDFIDSLISDKGIEFPDHETELAVKSEMKEKLLDQIDRAAVMALSEEKAAELAEKVNDPNFTNKDMTEFMQNSGVDLTNVALDTMLKFRSFYLGAEA